MLPGPASLWKVTHKRDLFAAERLIGVLARKNVVIVLRHDAIIGSNVSLLALANEARVLLRDQGFDAIICTDLAKVGWHASCIWHTACMAASCVCPTSTVDLIRQGKRGGGGEGAGVINAAYRCCMVDVGL